MSGPWVLSSILFATAAASLCLQDPAAVIKLDVNVPLLRYNSGAVEVLSRMNSSDVQLPTVSSLQAQLALLQARAGMLALNITGRSLMQRGLNSDVANINAKANYLFTGAEESRTGSKISWSSGLFTLASGTYRLFALSNVRGNGGTEDRMRLYWYNHDPAVNGAIGVSAIGTSPLASHRQASQPYAEAFLTVPPGKTTQVSYRYLALPAGAGTTTFNIFASFCSWTVEEL